MALGFFPLINFHLRFYSLLFSKQLDYEFEHSICLLRCFRKHVPTGSNPQCHFSKTVIQLSKVLKANNVGVHSYVKGSPVKEILEIKDVLEIK
jgi:hypothetical protein